MDPLQSIDHQRRKFTEPKTASLNDVLLRYTDKEGDNIYFDPETYEIIARKNNKLKDVVLTTPRQGDNGGSFVYIQLKERGE